VLHHSTPHSSRPARRTISSRMSNSLSNLRWQAVHKAGTGSVNSILWHRRHCQATPGVYSLAITSTSPWRFWSGCNVLRVPAEYPHPADDEWHSETLPALKKARLTDLVKESGMSKRALMDLRAERSTPHPKNQESLARIVRRLGLL
jgi:hypothetical protein